MSEVDFTPYSPSTSSWLTSKLNEAQVSIRGSLLNTMMSRMTEEEASILAQHMGYIEAKQKEQGVSAPSVVVEEEKISSPTEHNPYERYMQTQNSYTTDTETHLLHDQLGELVLDLGYKMIYRTSVVALSRTPVWEKQRILRPNRARAMADEKIRRGPPSMHIPGVITMFYDKETGKTGIIDGQHRAASLVLLSQEGHWHPFERNISVEVFHTEGEDSVMSLFTEINSAEPVRLIDMPTHDPVSSRLRSAIDLAVDQLEVDYPAMFGGSRCRAPNVNADKLRDDLFQSNFLPRNGIRTAKQLQRALLKVNRALARHKEEQWEHLVGKVVALNLEDGGEGDGDTDLHENVNESGHGQEKFELPKSFLTAHRKAKKNKFYLGLTSKWMDC
jgi:hypothetical protein